MLNALEEQGIAVPVASSADGDIMHEISSAKPMGAGAGARWREFDEGADAVSPISRSLPVGVGQNNCACSWHRGETLLTYADLQGSSKQARRASQIFPSSLASSTASIPPPLNTADSPAFGDSFTPITNHATYPTAYDSPAEKERSNSAQTQAQPTRIPQAGQQPLSRMISGTSLANSPAHPSPPPSSSLPASAQHASTPQRSNLAPSQSAPSGTLLPSPNNLPTSSNAPTTASSAIAPQSAADGTVASSSAKAAKESARQAASAFRVTLEDPCWKVLPAALKKYKINDDWKQYALFICFGNTGGL
jgi:hypothetical protein